MEPAAFSHHRDSEQKHEEQRAVASHPGELEPVTDGVEQRDGDASRRFNRPGEKCELSPGVTSPVCVEP